jgi:hypothetical protein
VKDWQYYDMMNVVFNPKNMTPWALQKEFFRALKKFYSFAGAMKMLRLYGPDACLRRLGLWFVIGLGLLFAKWQSSRRKSGIRDMLKEQPQKHVSISHT